MQVSALLIEDSLALRKAVIPAIKELTGIEVVAFAEDAHGALHLLEREPCHLVILDLFLDGGSGLDVLAGIRARGLTQPVMVLTNHATAEMRQRCLAAGASRVFDKAMELDAFFDHCQRLADGLRQADRMRLSQGQNLADGLAPARAADAADMADTPSPCGHFPVSAALMPACGTHRSLRCAGCAA